MEGQPPDSTRKNGGFSQSFSQIRRLPLSFKSPSLTVVEECWMPPLGCRILVMKACSLIAVLGLSLLASCADRNAVEACRELAGVRDKDGYLLVKGQELNDKVRAAMDKAALSK